MSSLLQKLYDYSTAYYAGKPLIDDATYDALVEQYKKEGGDVSRLPLDGQGSLFPKARHGAFMGSLDNIFDYEDLLDWGNRHQIDSYYVNPKLDGASLSLTYENSVLVMALTRGDGNIGDVVTENAKRFVPDFLAGSQVDGLIEIRGEVMIGGSAFQEFNKKRGGRYSNARNLASGSLRIADPDEVSQRPLVFIPHSLGACPSGLFASHSDYVDFLHSNGFIILPGEKRTSLSGAYKFAELLFENGDEYKIDGVVIRANSFSKQNELGWTSRTPRWAVALKKKSGGVATVVESISSQVGRTGAVTPVANLEPVTVGDVLVSRASLHNQDEINRLGLNVGDLVMVRRAGEVIPEIVAVVEKRSEGNFSLPKNCPSCHVPLYKESDEAVTYCPNPDCLEKNFQKLVYMFGKDGLDIKGLGASTIKDIMWVTNGTATPSQILSMSEKEIIGSTRLREKGARNLTESIQKAIRFVTLPMLIRCLGIRHVGEGTSKRLAAKFSSIDELLGATYADFCNIDDIGEETAMSLEDFFKDEDARKLIKDLQSIGINPVAEKASAPSLNGKTVLFTGSLSKPRGEMEKEAESHGYKVASGVSKKLDYLIVGEKPGSKLTKAQSLGLTILNEEEWSEKLF